MSLITLQEAAQHLKVSVATLRRAIRAGRLKPTWVAGRIRFSQQDLDAFVRNCTAERNARRQPAKKV